MHGSGEVVTYAQLEARSNQAAHLFRALGLTRGDAIAILMENGPRYFDLVWGAQRAGLLYTCISTKLTAPEVEYIVRDCGAKALFAGASLRGIAEPLAARLPDSVRQLSVGGAIPGYEGYEPLALVQPTSRIADESLGRDMLYSSGTTGRPKGIRSTLVDGEIDALDPLSMLVKMLYQFDGETRYLSPAPLYHAAPLRYCMSLHKLGATTVILEHFDPEVALQAIEQHRITHSQWVPTMFVRMLKLPADVRARYDTASLKVAIHAAAPCPIEVKEQMIAWWGPIVHEYYSATEGAGFTAISAQEWLTHKGSVGKAILGAIRIVDEDGRVLPPGEQGRVFFEGGPSFEYHNDQAKTAEARTEAGWATFGDIGYVDADGYLYLTDRKAFMIISGGVNVYPQEAENVLVMHPKVADVAVVGVPDADLGEAVKAVVQPVDWADATPELAAELVAFCRERLSHIKCPRSVDFEPALPRHPTGKLYKPLIRDRYWGKTGSAIV
jgi:acyl-CoA synthetase (AMP-forming)/AMP-acid ligase II